MSHEYPEYERPEGDNRKQRRAGLKRGPGWFVYDGKAVDIDDTPTIKMTNKKTPVIAPDGTVMLNANGVMLMQPAGIPERDAQGRVKMGGPPKRSYKPIGVYHHWGIDFPAGVPVYVKKPALALKLRAFPNFEEVEEPAKQAGEPEAPKKRGRPKKTE